MPAKKENIKTVKLMDMLKEYATKEQEFIANADPNKVYHRVLPNIKTKDSGTIDFLYKKIILGGLIEKDTVYLNKLRVTKEGNEKDIDEAIAKVTEVINKGDMKLVNELK